MPFSLLNGWLFHFHILLVGFLQVWFSLDWEGRLESWLHWCCWRHHWLSHGWELGGRQETKTWHLPIRREWHLVPHGILLHSHHPLLKRIHVWELRKYWLLHAFSWKPTRH